MKAVILAAGFGKRLKKTFPKSLIEINGKSIIQNQIDIYRKFGIKEIYVVVGFKKEILMEEIKDVFFAYNNIYHITNTAYSLYIGLKNLEPDDVIWSNADVIFEDRVLEKILKFKGNAIAVKRGKCEEEEVKFKTAQSGVITEISKKIKDGEGEAIGVNKITKRDFKKFVENLKKCSLDDFFEKAIEYSIKDGITFKAVDVTELKCIEIDFEEDLKKAVELFQK